MRRQPQETNSETSRSTSMKLSSYPTFTLLLATLPFGLSCTDCWCMPKGFKKGLRLPVRVRRGALCPCIRLRKTTLEYSKDGTITKFASLPDPQDGLRTFYPPLMNDTSVDCQPSPATAALLGVEECERVEPSGFTRGKAVVCAYKYTSNEKKCQDRTYIIKEYQNRWKARKDGAVVVHKGKCGVCSSASDLARYMQPDLDLMSAKCGFVFTAISNGTFTWEGAFTRAMLCFVNEIGFTEDCAHLWAVNAFNTGLFCSDACTAFLDPGSPPPPPNDPETCELAECLQCDEDRSGPAFKEFGGLTRHRAGIVVADIPFKNGTIAVDLVKRECGTIANIVHEQDCTPPTPTPTTP